MTFSQRVVRTVLGMIVLSFVLGLPLWMVYMLPQEGIDLLVNGCASGVVWTAGMSFFVWLSFKIGEAILR